MSCLPLDRQSSNDHRSSTVSFYDFQKSVSSTFVSSKTLNKTCQVVRLVLWKCINSQNLNTPAAMFWIIQVDYSTTTSSSSTVMANLSFSFLFRWISSS
jgi:hypothetical protein